MNVGLALACAPLIVVSLLVVSTIVRQRGGKTVHSCFLSAGITVLLWQLSCIVEFLVRSEAVLLYIYNVTVAFTGFAALGFLLLTLYFYGLGEYLCSGVIKLMLVLPGVTMAMALAGDPFLLLHSELEIVSATPVYQVHRVPGAWFWAHAVYCLVVLVMGIYHAIAQHRRLSKAFRECSSLMVAAQLIISGTVVHALVSTRGAALVLTVAGTCCAMVALYVAMINNDRMNYLYMARIHILDQLDTSIFILDKDRNILEANQAARDSLETWTGKRITDSLEDVMQQLQDMGARFENAVEGEKGMDVSISTEEISRVYNVREEVLPDKDGRELGHFVTCTDVTRNRRLIRWLEQTSGTDELTGLPNRSSLALRRADYESNEALPLSVIAGDVNGLKQVNDTLGHHYGDRMLVAVGRALEDSIPPEGAAYRTGGDEFVIILPGTGPEEAAQVVEAVEQALAAVEIGSFQPSMALGCATRTRQSLSLEEVMHLADQNMYLVKKSKRV